jgi:hypothetical protein
MLVPSGLALVIVLGPIHRLPSTTVVPRRHDEIDGAHVAMLLGIFSRAQKLDQQLSVGNVDRQ